MSSSDSDEENSIQKTKKDSKVNSDQETKLEADLKLLQVKETNNNSQSSTTEEGSTVKKKSSAHNLSYEESIRNIERPEPSLTDIFISNKFSSTQNTPSMRSTTAEGTLGADAANWRSLRNPNPKEKKESISVSSSLSWRDPHFKYERQQNDNSSSRKWGNDDIRENRSRSFENKPTYLKNRETSKRGNWSLSCAPDIVLDNGLTEIEHFQNCVNELHEQNGELFATRHPNVFKKPNGAICINCYTSNYEDKVHVAKVADILVEKIGYYPYCFLYFHGNKPLYMRTCEKEFYEFNENNFKLIDFDE